MKTDPTQNKHHGNAQSVAAFATIADSLTNRRNDVLSVILRNPDGVTSKEIAETLDMPLHAISGRITELKERGRITEHGKRDGCAVLVIASTQPPSDVLDRLRTAYAQGDDEDKAAIKITVEAHKRGDESEKDTVNRRIEAHLSLVK